MQLRRRFLVALVAVGLVVAAITLVGFTLYRDAVMAGERADLTRTSESVATQLEVVLDEKRRLVRLRADHPALRDHASDRQASTLATFVRETTFSGASVIAANGTMTAIYAQGLNDSEESALVGQSFERRTYVRRAIAGETYVSKPVDAASGFTIVTISTPIEADGDIVGTFNAAFHVRAGDLGAVVETTGTETSGVHVVADETTVLRQGPGPDAADARIVANATVESTGWTVVATGTRGAVQSRLWVVTGLQAGAVLLVFGVLAAFGWWLSREYVRNVERLSEGFDSLVAGDYGSRVALSGAAEWDRLESQFNELSETLAQRRTEVTVLNRVLRHNLRNAMTVVVGNADRIAAATDDETIAEDATRIRRRGESLLELADHARAIESSLGDHDSESAVRPAGEILGEVGAVLADEFPAAVVTTDIADADVLVPSGDLLVVVLDELGRNGIVHDLGDPRVDFAVTADGDRVRFVVGDDGPGLPPVERRVLTEPFVETPTQHGSGLGLWLVTWLVARIDGEISVSVGDGTRVTVTVPRADREATDATAGDDVTGTDDTAIADDDPDVRTPADASDTRDGDVAADETVADGAGTISDTDSARDDADRDS
jgi:signal transduction histidine kinase